MVENGLPAMWEPDRPGRGTHKKHVGPNSSSSCPQTLAITCTTGQRNQAMVFAGQLAPSCLEFCDRLQGQWKKGLSQGRNLDAYN
jgi:hypothetical protein